MRILRTLCQTKCCLLVIVLLILIYYLGKLLKEELMGSVWLNSIMITTEDPKKFNQRMDKVATQRRNRLAEACMENGLVTSNELFLSWHPNVEAKIAAMPSEKRPRLLVSDQHKTMYCAIDGTGSDDWEYLITRMEKGEGKPLNEIDQRFFKKGNERYELRVLWDYHPKSVEYRMKNYYKFMVVREPILRLFSIYKSTIKSLETSQTKNRYIPLFQVISAEHKHLEMPLLEEPVSFSQLSRYLTSENEPTKEATLLKREYHDLCMPCHIDYNFIARAESIEDDAKYILQHVGVKNVSLPHRHAEALKLVSWQDIGKNITEEVPKLYEIYKRDYNLFGYSKPYT